MRWIWLRRVCVFWMSIGILWAQEEGMQKGAAEAPVYQLDSVVVTAQYEPIHYTQSLFPITVIPKVEIERLPAFTARELLFTLPTLRLSYDDVQGSTVELDGIGGEHVKILWNGIPVEGRLKGVLDLSQLALINVQRVEVIRGPVSTFYGSNALGGAINIITETPYPLPRIRPAVAALVDSRGAYQLRGGIRWSIGQFPFSLSGSLYRFPGLKTQETVRKYDFIPRTQYAGLFSWGFPVGPLYGTLYSFAVWDEQKNALEPRRATDTLAYDEWYRTARWINALVLAGDLRPDLYARFVAAYTTYRRHRLVYQVDLPTGATQLQQDRSDTTAYYTAFSRGFLTFRQLLPHLQMHVGYEFTHQTLTTARIRDRQQSVYDASVFLSSIYTVQDWLKIQPSLRWGWTRTFAVPLTPTLHIGVQPVQSLRINFTYARGFRSPTIKELYLYFPFYWKGKLLYEIVGNENLRPERSQHFAAAVRWEGSVRNWQIQSEVRGFMNDVTDLIERVPTSGGDTITYRNRAEYKTHGVEVNIRLRSATTMFKFSVAYIGRSNAGAEAFEEIEPYSYSPDAAIVFHQQIPWISAIAWAQCRFVGKQPGYLIDTRNHTVTRGQIDSYTLLDFGVSRTFFDGKCRLSVGIHNLLNVQLVEDTLVKLPRGQTTPPPRPVSWGRTFFAKLHFVW